MNKIIIELCQEDRERLDLLSSAIIALGDALLKGRAPAAVAQPAEKVEEVNEHPVDAVSPHGRPESVVEPEQPKYTKADVMAKVQKLATPNSPNREQAKAIVKSYGAKISDIPEDKYDEVMAKLAELEV